MRTRPTRTAAAAAQHRAPAASAGLPAALAAAIGLLREERLDAAEPALHAILERWPGQPDALHYLGVLRHAQGRVDEAVSLIRRALAAMPGFAGAWNNLGNVLLLAGRGPDAAEAYEQAVSFAGAGADTEAARALNNLGVLHRKLHRLDRSEAVLREATVRDPTFADAWYNLSITLLADEARVPEGLNAHSKAIALAPEDAQPRQEVIRALLRLNDLGRAARMLREWLADEPGNPVAEHMLAASLAAGAGAQAAAPPERASNDYVRQVFDSFAASFDAKLEALHYQAPAHVVQALRASVGEPAARLSIADAGCGTGLCGPGLKPYASRLAGCDLSEGMLRRAKQRGHYDVLHQAELMHYLRTQPFAFDAVVSADTLCYFGALDAVCTAAHSSLKGGGVFVFTVEALPADDEALGHRLQTCGRFAHGPGHLRSALEGAGFAPPLVEPRTLRLEGGEPVHGWLVTAVKPAAAGG